MHLVNDSPSFTPVHSQIRAIGPQDLHLGKGRGQKLAAYLPNPKMMFLSNLAVVSEFMRDGAGPLFGEWYLYKQFGLLGVFRRGAISIS